MEALGPIAQQSTLDRGLALNESLLGPGLSAARGQSATQLRMTSAVRVNLVGFLFRHGSGMGGIAAIKLRFLS